MGSAAMFVMLFGGDRSGKTFIIIRAIVIRALAAAGSRNAVLALEIQPCKSLNSKRHIPKGNGAMLS